MFTALMLMIGIASTSAAQTEDRSFGAPDTVVVRSDSLTLRGLFWKPDGPGPFPAVLFNHGSGPQSDLTRPAKIGPAFASHGYVVSTSSDEARHFPRIKERIPRS